MRMPRRRTGLIVLLVAASVAMVIAIGAFPVWQRSGDIDVADAAMPGQIEVVVPARGARGGRPRIVLAPSDAMPFANRGEENMPPAPAFDGGVLSGRQLGAIDPVSKDMIQASIRQVVTPRMKRCAIAFLGRRSHHILERAIELDFKMKAFSRAEKGAISDVRTDAWPDEVDDEMKSCVLEAFRGVEFETDAYEFSYDVSYPFRLNPPPRPEAWPEGSRLHNDAGAPR